MSICRLCNQFHKANVNKKRNTSGPRLGLLPLRFTMADSSPVPVVMITDIGRDPDDTVALLALLAYRPEFELVGVVTSGASERMRADLVMEWLDIVGCNDAVRGADCCTGVLGQMWCGESVRAGRGKMSIPCSGLGRR